MKKGFHMFKRTGINALFCLLLLLLCGGSYAAETEKVAYLQKSSIVPGGTLRLQDGLYPEEVADTSLYKAKRKHEVRLVYTRDRRTDLSGSWYLVVDYQLFRTNAPGSYESGTDSIFYNAGGGTSVYESVKEHTGGGSGYGDATLLITGVRSSGTVPSDVVLELVTILERYTDLNTSAAPVLFYNSSTSEVSWSFVPGAEEYDLEYTFIDATENHWAFSSSDEPFQYREPVRITTGNQHYVMDNVFPAGKIYFRIRAVGKHINDYSHTNTGGWGYVNSAGIPVTKLITTGFESDKNWSFEAGYAEEGKSKKGLSYVDGNGKVRQWQVSMNSDNTTLVSENKYDIEGRAVISVLPVPLSNTVVTDVFKYQSYFNTDTSGGRYDYQDFQSGPAPMGTGSGAGNYYSSANTATDHATPFTASANGYPFTQISYMRDNTGRISKTSGGAGDVHRIGGGHEISYFYGTANSTELHRLFGSNVGEASHYKKNFVKDANGQVSVSYLDQEGRVIATALTGPAPENLEQLEDYDSQNLTVSLNKNNVLDEVNHRRVQTSAIVNPSPSPVEYTFSYDMKGVIYGTDMHVDAITARNELTGETDTCQPAISSPICADCKYKLSIQITDPDGLIVQIPDNSTLVDELTRNFSNPSNPNCANNQYSVTPLSFTIELDKQGTYTVNKVLELDTTGIDADMTAAMHAIGLDTAYQTSVLSCLEENTDYSQCDITCEQECKTVIHREHPTWSELDEDFIEALNICKQTNCDPQVVIDQQINDMILSPCNDMLKILKSEVAPGGFEFVQNNPYVSTQTDLDYWDRVDYLMDAYASSGLSGDPTEEQLKDRRYIIFLDNSNHLLSPQPSLSDIKNGAFWNGKNKEQWILQLVKADRDYCHYENCLKKAASDIYDVKLSQIADAATAKSLGYLDPMGMSRTTPYEGGGSLIPLSFPSGVGTTGTDVYVDYLPSGVDPLFEKRYLEIGAKRNGVEIPCGESILPCEAYEDLAKWLSIDSISFNDGNGHSDIWHYVFDANSVLYKTPSGAGLDFNNDQLKWKLFRGLYLSQKLKWENIHLTTSCLCCPYYEDSKIQHPHYNNEIVPTDEKIQESYDMANDCGEKCTYNVLQWMDQLQHYVDSSGCGDWSSISAADKAGLRYHLLQYCQSHCGATNPQGFILDGVLSPTLTDPYLLLVKATLTTAGCGTALNYLSSGSPYVIECTAVSMPRIQATQVKACFDELVEFIIGKSSGCYDMGSSCLGGGYLKIDGSAFMVSSSSSCSPSTCGTHVFRFYTADGYALPVNEITSISLPRYTIGSPLGSISGTFKNVQCVANTTTKGQVQVYVYEEAVGGCTDYELTETVVLYDPGSPSTICIAKLDESTQMQPARDYDAEQQQCIDRLHAYNAYQSKKLYQQQVRSFKEAYLESHYSQCFSSHQVETFSYSYLSREYHYTLYYYDQAGNLVQTVPPKGVHPVSSASFTAAGEYDGTTEPVHTFLTRYTYNGLNQVRSQETPDGGLTSYYYDREGKLLASQNARQKAGIPEKFSYTLYDDYRRIVEVGQSEGNPSVSTIPVNVSDVRHIYYDLSGMYTGRFKEGQRNLRNRVTGLDYYEFPGWFPTSSTHYSYDEHGHVDELLQVNRWLSLGSTMSENTFSYLRYQYDLLSGNVKEVAYQPGQADAFYHRYVYDADNRLKIALTSSNGLTWEKDAKYFYYKHGPLSRTEIGEDKVQGMDYAYTLNGWLKGINASTLNSSRDMGKDGGEGTNVYMGKDALGFSLGYYDDDYAAIGSSSWEAVTKSTPLSSGNYRNLYNGNITRTVNTFLNDNQEAVAGLGKAYHYDQLNRLKSASAYTGSNIATNNTFAGTTNTGDYQEEFGYDLNGNIQTVSRYGNGSKMDNLSYLYASNTNKLQQVRDQGPGINSSNYADDIDDQTETDNYGYYENGDLKWDKAEEIDSIEWNVYGKVKSITRSSSSTRSDLEFKYDGHGHRICKIVKPRTGSGIKNEEDWLYTYYTRDAQGNVMAVYNRKLSLESGTVKDRYTLKEHHLYGSSRLGVEQKEINLGGIDFTNGGYVNHAFVRPWTGTLIAGDTISQPSRMVNDKAYELSNHLGNVMVVVSDKKTGVDADTAGTEKQAESYTAEVISSQDYYAFGAMMPGRKYSGSSNYRYAFGGKENDSEMKGEGNSYNFDARMYDPRLGRWLAVDPQAERYTSYSPYHAMYCNPIAVKDDDGEENIVVVGNQGSSPNSDKNSWYKGGGYRYGENKKHFLQKGLVEAVRLKNYNTENNEETTMLVYEGDYTKSELDMYEAIAKKAGVNFVRCQTAAEIKDYINRSGGYAHNQPSPNGRGDDLITDFSYIGHGLWNSFLVGHDYNDINANISGNDLSPDAFSNDCNANLLGCGNGLDMADYFRDHLVGGNIYGYRTTAIWGQNGLGSVAPHTQEYTRPGIERYSPTRKDLPEADRHRNEKGRAGKDGNVNGEKSKKREPQPSVGGGGRKPEN